MEAFQIFFTVLCFIIFFFGILVFFCFSDTRDLHNGQNLPTPLPENCQPHFLKTATELATGRSEYPISKI